MFETFNESLRSVYDSTPGITWKTHKTMRAAADGIVGRIRRLYTGRHGGLIVTISHGDNIVTDYRHLENLYVESSDPIKRGDPIGHADYGNIPKLLLKVNFNFENPDNWGPNHGLMVKREELSEVETYNTDQTWKMLFNQRDIIRDLYQSIGVHMSEWLVWKHNPGRRWDAVARWSLVEHMRYLECLYKTEPQKFKGMSSENFQMKRDQFYKNQPLVLTKPF
jgi:hypothetical protein